MKFRRLGNSGLKVSVIGLGTNQFGGKVDARKTNNIITAALDVGINFIDTADVYQEGRSEKNIGKALQGKRDKAIIATKVFLRTGDGPNDIGASRQHILDGVDASLKRLDTDWIDLYQVHRWDQDTPIEETMQVLDDLIRVGKVRYIGSSNYSAWQMTHANAVARQNQWTEFVSVQPHYHMFEREIEAELIPACNFFNWGILPFFPLAGGFLTGKYKKDQSPPSRSRGETSEYVQQYMTPENYEILNELEGFSQLHGRGLNQLAHAWLLAQPKVSSVISGGTKVEHVLTNAEAADWELTPEEYSLINDILNS